MCGQGSRDEAAIQRELHGLPASLRSPSNNAATFALEAPRSEPLRTWPVELGIPLANGLSRAAFILRPPFPAGNLGSSILRENKLLDHSCLAPVPFSTGPVSGR
jgi:hypothetical protein